MVAPVEAFGPETTVSSGTFPQIITLADGSKLAVWLAGGIYFQRLDADLVASSDPVPLGVGGYFSVTALSSGGFAIINSGNYARVFLFDSEGAPVGDPLLLGYIPYKRDSIDIAALPDGGFVASWFGSDGIEIAYFDSTGAMFANYTLGQMDGGEPSLTVLSNGNVAIFHSREDTETPREPYADGYEVVGRIFSPEGSPLTDYFLVNETQVGSHGSSDSVLLSNGNIAVTWQVNGENGGIFLRVFAADGTAITGAIRVSDLDPNWQSYPDIVATSTGFLISWTDASPNNPDDVNRGIRAQLFDNLANAVGEPFQVNDDFVREERQQDVAIVSPTEAVAIYVAEGNSGPTGLLLRSIEIPLSGTIGADTWTGTGVDERYLGLDGDDFLAGAGGDDFLSGDAGNDTIFGQWGNDRLNGGDGNDDLSGGAGWDFLSGGEGDDVLRGNNGNDWLDGQAGSDSLFGEAGDDTLTGSAGINSIDGGEGSDTASYVDAPYALYADMLAGFAQVDSPTEMWSRDNFANVENIDGTAFDDTILGNDEDNILRGMGGDDVLLGRGSSLSGANTLMGGEGDDLLLAVSGSANLFGGSGDDFLRGHQFVDTYNGGPGFDRVSFFFRDATQGVVADLRTGVISNDGFGNVETMSGIEALGGSTQFADLLYGDDGRNFISGGYGGDLLYGFGGADVFGLYGAPELVDGGEGNDTVHFTDYAIGPDLDGDGLGDDVVAYEGIVVNLGQGLILADGMGGSGAIVNVENIVGHAFADVLTGDDAANMIFGESGSDVLSGGSGNDELHGGDGWDTLIGGDWSDKLYGDNGNDRLIGGYGADTLSGGNGHDSLSGGAGTDSLDGWYGDDILDGGGHDDILWGGAGNDVLIGGWGVDTLVGGGGADTYLFRAGHSGAWLGNADTIMDFNQSEGDVIDLSAIDAIAGGSDDAFTFIADAAFSGTAGELRFSTNGDRTLVEADMDGDGVADFMIYLNGVIDLTNSDFIL